MSCFFIIKELNFVYFGSINDTGKLSTINYPKIPSLLIELTVFSQATLDPSAPVRVLEAVRQKERISCTSEPVRKQ